MFYTPHHCLICFGGWGQLSRAAITVVSTGSPVGCGSGHCTWGCWLTKQLHGQSIHRQDGLVAYSLYNLFVFGHWLLVRQFQVSSRPYHTYCYICTGLLDWWKPLADCPIPLFLPVWDFLKEESSDITYSAFSGSENIPVQEPVFIQCSSFSECWSEHLTHPHMFT